MIFRVLVIFKIDVAIEFSEPHVAFNNIRTCIENGIKVISGTTGWLEKLTAVKEICHNNNGTFLHASNFSVGVNLFFEINEWLSKKIAHLKYEPKLKEIHHTEKKR